MKPLSLSKFTCSIFLLFVMMTFVLKESPADVVLDWNEILLEAIRMDKTNPPKASRAMAMVHCAVFNAVNGFQGKYEPYHFSGKAPKKASPKASAAAAAHQVLVHLYPAQQATFDAALAESLQGIKKIRRNRGAEWGKVCADAMIALRQFDGSSDAVAYTPPSGPGFWVPTPPGFLPALLPNWPFVTPWAMESGDQFRSSGPPDLTSDEYTLAFDEVKDFGRVDSAVRTSEQADIALFWADGVGTETPPGHWNSIAGVLSENRGNSMLENARLFALLNVTLADAAIVSWDNKYYYNHWRPVTGIQEAATDGNDDTEADSEWLSFIATPPFPAYTSGHSTFSSSAAKVLALFFGNDSISFSTDSDGLPGVIRSFNSFSEAAEEAGQSRIYGGIHWQYDNQDAQEAGQALGEYTYAHFFRPVRDLDQDGDVDLDD